MSELFTDRLHMAKIQWKSIKIESSQISWED